MRKLAMLGGMSYESTQVYYQLINKEINKALGGSHSADLFLYSFDYAELESLLELSRWDLLSDRLILEGLKLKSIGAEGLILCANTMHHIADQVESEIKLPLIHIVKETLTEVKKLNIKKVGLIGTRYTMKSFMYPNIFTKKDVQVVTPIDSDQEIIHDIIYKELIIGLFREESRQTILKIIESMHVDGIILGCTELPLLILSKHVRIPLFNTMDIHAKAAAKWMLDGELHDL